MVLSKVKRTPRYFKGFNYSRLTSDTPAYSGYHIQDRCVRLELYMVYQIGFVLFLVNVQDTHTITDLIMQAKTSAC